VAQLDPAPGDYRPLAVVQPRFKLRIHELTPEDFTPLGDRYIVEQIDIDERALMLSKLLVMTQPMVDKPGDPMADPTVEQRGVIAAIVVCFGNGHLLGLPDPAVALSPRMDAYGTRQEDYIGRASADVPMFLSPGTLVLVDYNAKGRALKILGRECRIVNQIDCLAYHKTLKFRRSEDGSWEREEA